MFWRDDTVLARGIDCHVLCVMVFTIACKYLRLRKLVYKAGVVGFKGWGGLGVVEVYCRGLGGRGGGGSRGWWGSRGW